MPSVNFTYALKRFFPDLREIDLKAESLSDLLAQLEKKYPGLRAYVLDEQGRLRRHVNIFIDGELIADRDALTDPFRPDSEIYIMQALSGG